MALRVAVIGAGPAGLCAARHSLEAGWTVTVFEQSDAIGGTWQYTDRVGVDSYGVPIHTSMYRDLRTNVPKEVVMFQGFPHKEYETSYVSSEKILQYLNDFADTFNIKAHCKFNHQVKVIKRSACEWEITTLNLPTSIEHTYTFDALFVCNGINNKPYTSYIEGAENFAGLSLHSHDYRRPDDYKGHRVLLIGGGASGLDLTHHISQWAEKVFFSHHSTRLIEQGNTRLRKNAVFKTDVTRLRASAAEFADGTVEEVDTIIYCTGYRCNYKFLHESCGITEDDGLVYPLYKHFINANQTSMCILGNMCLSMQFPTFDIQVRFFIKTLKEPIILPSKDEMLDQLKEIASKKLVDGKSKKTYFHSTFDEDEEYYKELAEMADIEPVPKVLIKIFARAETELFANFPKFREENYKIIDDETFTVTPVT